MTVHEHDDPGRRRDDPYRELNDRLSALERDFSRMRTELNTIKLEQTHMSSLFTARFATLEKAQELMIAELRAVNQGINSMASEADKSPAGRSLLNLIEEHSHGAMERNHQIRHLQEWQTKADGVFSVLTFVGWSGLITAGASLFWVAMRAFGKLP
jgi:hypothetical protein